MGLHVSKGNLSFCKVPIISDYCETFHAHLFVFNYGKKYIIFTFFTAGVNILYQTYKKNIAISLIPTHKSMTYRYKMVGQ